MDMRQMAAQDGEEIVIRANGQEWIASWHPPFAPPDGTPHGASAVCVTRNGRIVLISPDGQSWGLPGGRPEQGETWEATMRREVLEEACATVTHARLLGFSRGTCIAGPEQGLVLVRSLWRADIELAPWNPLFEIPHRRVFPESDVWNLLVAAHTDGSAPILIRAFHEATT